MAGGVEWLLIHSAVFRVLDAMASKARPMGALKRILVIQRLNFILREEVMILMDVGAETQLTRQ